MKQYGKKRIFFGCLAAAMAVGLQAGGLWWSGRAEPTFARLTQQTLIIDPGHGGEDGGAVSASGQAESQINLAIARFVLRCISLTVIYIVNCFIDIISSFINILLTCMRIVLDLVTMIDCFIQIITVLI